MILIYDECNDWWVWVDEADRTTDLSPYFYYEDDAVNWRRRMHKELKDENKRTDNHQHVLYNETRLWIEP